MDKPPRKSSMDKPRCKKLPKPRVRDKPPRKKLPKPRVREPLVEKLPKPMTPKPPDYPPPFVTYMVRFARGIRPDVPLLPNYAVGQERRSEGVIHDLLVWARDLEVTE
jgi:hypothetical protein